MGEPVQIEIRGKTYDSFRDAARDLGVTDRAVKKAFKRGTLDNCGLGLSQPVPIKIRGVVYESQGEAARALGVSKNTIQHALDRGTLDKCGTGKKVQPVQVFVDDKIYQSLGEAERELGLPARSLSEIRRTRRGVNVVEYRGYTIKFLDDPAKKPIFVDGKAFESSAEAEWQHKVPSGAFSYVRWRETKRGKNSAKYKDYDLTW